MTFITAVVDLIYVNSPVSSFILSEVPEHSLGLRKFLQDVLAEYECTKPEVQHAVQTYFGTLVGLYKASQNPKAAKL
jgi:hypothetical protein